MSIIKKKRSPCVSPPQRRATCSNVVNRGQPWKAKQGMEYTFRKTPGGIQYGYKNISYARQEIAQVLLKQKLHYDLHNGLTF